VDVGGRFGGRVGPAVALRRGGSEPSDRAEPDRFRPTMTEVVRSRSWSAVQSPAARRRFVRRNDPERYSRWKLDCPLSKPVGDWQSSLSNISASDGRRRICPFDNRSPADAEWVIIPPPCVISS